MEILLLEDHYNYIPQRMDMQKQFFQKLQHGQLESLPVTVPAWPVIDGRLITLHHLTGHVTSPT